MTNHIRPPKGVAGTTRSFPTPYQRAVGRIRGPLLLAWAVLAVVEAFFADLSGWLMLGATIVVFAIYFYVGTPKAIPRNIHSPVVGRWKAMNSPASRVPSHMVHAYGQTYAIDLTHHPEDGDRPRAGAFWPPAHSPEDYPSFGQPVLAPVDGTVVKVHHTARDHLSRTSWIGVLYLLVESTVREMVGLRGIVGNHIVIDDGEGAFALVAHLRQHSVRVREGEEVEAGQLLAECGNSGNSTEPHVHVQMMDHPNPYFACGLPFQFEPDTIGADHAGVPSNGHAMVGTTRPAAVGE